MALAGVMFWGVPYYIDDRVEIEVAEILEEQGKSESLTDAEAAIDVLESKVDAVQATATANGQKTDNLALFIAAAFKDLADN